MIGTSTILMSPYFSKTDKTKAGVNSRYTRPKSHSRARGTSLQISNENFSSLRSWEGNRVRLVPQRFSPFFPIFFFIFSLLLMKFSYTYPSWVTFNLKIAVCGNLYFSISMIYVRNSSSLFLLFYLFIFFRACV